MRKTNVVWYLLTFIPILLLVLGYIYPNTFFSSQDKIRSYIQSYGTLAPLVFTAIQISQVIITPLNHYAIGIVGGFLFGTWNGFLFNWIGRVLGSLIAFYLGRIFGRKIIQQVVEKETITKYDKVFDKGKLILFLMYFLPLFPDDELCYLVGFSSMRAKDYIPIMILGHIGGSLGLAYLGSGFSLKDPIFILLSVISLVGGMAFIIFYRRIQIEKKLPSR